jgi:hypothetical protein
MYEVQIVVRGVGSATEDQLEGLSERVALLLGVEEPAVIYWPRDKELGACFQIEEEVLEQLLQPGESSLAA